jgi:hypothetical protein
MPQTTTADNAVNAIVEVSTNGTTWTNISGTANKVEVAPMTVQSGMAHTLEGGYPIVRVGKYEPTEITLTLVYTETASEGYALLHAQRDLPGRPWYFRYTPFGYDGNWRYKSADSNGNTAPARITSFPLPPVDASDAKPAMVVIKMQATQLVRENATPSPSASLSPSASASA